MAGTEFGHALGRSRALSGLPAAPLEARYGELVSAQQALGLSHLGELLVPPGGRLRVLDGIFAVEGPGRRRHVGAEALRELRGLRAARGDAEGGAGALLDRLAGIQERDPAALRRILLYQLVRLLHDHPRGDLPETAAGFGVDPDEAAALVHAAAASPRLDPAQRAAAEGLEDALLAGRVRAAARSAALLPRGAAGGDPLLAGRLAGLAERVRAADALLDEARAYEDRQDREQAAAAYGRAARLAWDCPRAVRGLVRTHRPAEGDPGPLEARPVSGGVALRRPPGADPDGIWRVVRLTRREPVTTPLPEVPGPLGAGPLTDGRAPLGREVRYVALPGDGGTPLISAPLLVAPEVTELRLTDGRARLEAAWLRPPGATGVRVTLTDPEGRTTDLGAPSAAGPAGAGAADPADPATAAGPAGSGREGVRAGGLGPGGHVVRVRCRYAGAAGEVLSGGVEAAVTVHPWPEPVVGLSAAARGAGGLELRWAGGAGGDVRFVEWPGAAPAEGAELPASALPAALTWVDSAGIAQPPPGTLATVSAVAVLGERALAGPGVAVEAPEAVSGLTVRRTSAGRAKVSFDWPDGAGRVTVAVTPESGGEPTEHPVVRAVFLREGLELPVGPGAVRITAYAAPRSAHAVAAAPRDAGQAALPADVAIAYRLLPGPRRMLRRGPAVLRVSLLSPGGDPGSGLPDFVLVSGAGGGGARPHRPSDGAELCRVTGAELAVSGTVEREIVPHPPGGGPYAVRGFLLGGRAASVRLDEPSLTSLVVR
ncbi:hypothetical protein [Streptomyces sp. NRRL S-244]|uniref:hypothetical protein n=1 Tax=Streptomyces sp. NRRL S-244 TaxID=1463897 RepID=UPI0004C08DCC|nr:hypothetical protein [Streptomyces sp. NRRL S-244]